MPAPREPMRFAHVDGAHLAYLSVGDHPETLTLVFDTFSSVDDLFDLRVMASALDQLARFRRLLLVNARGTGASDPFGDDFDDYPDRQADDVIAVLDHAGIDHTDYLGQGWTTQTGVMLGARHPDRIGRIILANGQARTVAGDGYEHAQDPELYDAFGEGLAHGVISATDQLAVLAPTIAADPPAIEWFDRSMRRGASPGTVEQLFELGRRADVRDLLPRVSAPVLVLHRADNAYVPAAAGRHLAEHLPDARYVEVPGADHHILVGDTASVVDEIEEFLAGTRTGRSTTRALRTILFTDLVSSTDQATRLGDSRWRDLLDNHDRLTREMVTRHGGEVVKTTGDGCLALFDGPSAALRATEDLDRSLTGQGLSARFGVHTGEVELRDDDVGGIAVHLAARVMDKAEPNEILVSEAVPLLMIGSRVTFEEKGTVELKGLDGTWRLHRVRREAGPAPS
jgi:class 3 adenylate cyclase